MINFIIGLFIGAFLGVTIMALFSMAKDTEPPKGKPAKLWLSGNICRYKGDVYTIIGMTPGDHQTWTLLENENGKVIAPTEELEEVEE
ncbi:MAG: hypothetical protein IJ598_04800 [Ruminococcus sp.]|nr:hypothetical protein [Ruminococcus sp.]